LQQQLLVVPVDLVQMEQMDQTAITQHLDRGLPDTVVAMERVVTLSQAKTMVALVALGVLLQMAPQQEGASLRSLRQHTMEVLRSMLVVVAQLVPDQYTEEEVGVVGVASVLTTHTVALFKKAVVLAL